MTMKGYEKWKCKTEIISKGSLIIFRDYFDETYSVEEIINEVLITSFGDIKISTIEEK